MQNAVRTIHLFSVITGMLCQAAHAGAFSLYTEGSAVEIGNFAAGSAAEAPDASIGWFNPAGLVLLNKSQSVLSGVGVLPNIQLSGESSYATTGLPTYTQSFQNLQGAKSALVPALHLAHPIAHNAVLGFSLVSPMGESTSWDNQSAVRYAATLTKLLTVNASPEMGAMLSKHCAIGAGLDLQWARVEFNAIAGAPALYQLIGQPTLVDSSSINQGASFGVGVHAGILGLFNDQHTRIGFNYQSSISHTFYGNSVLTGRLADPDVTNPNAVYSTGALNTDTITFPNIMTLSGYQELNAQWAVLGSLVYTGWHVFDNISLKQIAGFSLESDPPQVPINSTTTEDYRDGWRVASGINYHVTPRWMMRVGGGYDQTPTIGSQRDIRLPDVNRWALSIGSHLQVTQALGIDVGYTHLFGQNRSAINKTQALDNFNSVTIQATAKNSAQLAGIQAVWAFDRVVSPTNQRVELS